MCVAQFVRTAALREINSGGCGRAADIARQSPKSLTGEGVAGTRFQIALKREGLSFRGECQIRLQSPRPIWRRAHIFSRIMVNHALTEISRRTDIAFSRHGFALNQIDVVHRGYLDPRYSALLRQGYAGHPSLGAISARTESSGVRKDGRAIRSSQSEGWRRGRDSNSRNLAVRIFSKDVL